MRIVGFLMRVALGFLLVSGAPLSYAERDAAVLEPVRPDPTIPRYRQVPPKPTNNKDFVARARHVLTLAKARPAPDGDPWFKIDGLSYWPAGPISHTTLKLLERETGAFEQSLRDRALRCAQPTNLPREVQVIILEARESDLAVPVFLSPDSDELHYIEVSLDRPGPPVLLVVQGYNGLAMRVTTSAATRLAHVHFRTYYPSVALGVDPQMVTQIYHGEDSGCRYDSPAKGYVLTGATRYRTAGQANVAIGAPQAVKRFPPTLGTFLDPEMPAPHQYGILVLANEGYVRPTALAKSAGTSYPDRVVLEVLKPFRVPEGLFGGHSVTFLLRQGSPVPSGDLAHSKLLLERHGIDCPPAQSDTVPARGDHDYPNASKGDDGCDE